MHERRNRVQGVEEEMRIELHLQRLQPRLGQALLQLGVQPGRMFVQAFVDSQRLGRTGRPPAVRAGKGGSAQSPSARAANAPDGQVRELQPELHKVHEHAIGIEQINAFARRIEAEALRPPGLG